MSLLCADIGGSFIRVGRVDAVGQVTDVASAATPANDWNAFVAVLRSLAPPGEGTLGIAIAGMLARDGQVAAANIPCLAGHRVALELAEALGRPVVIGNDADCFALAEASNGAGRGHDVVLGIILGSGVGGGLVVGGRIVPGAGEWGHAPVVTSGPLALLQCGCGQRGCVDTIGSARGLERWHAALTGTALDSRAVVTGWLAGDAGCTEAVEAYVGALAGPLAFAVNITAASVVPVGGGLGSSVSLVAALDAAVRPLVLGHSYGPLLVPALHAIGAGLAGAALLAAQAAG